MRDFNKLFVVSLPRCATMSMSEALNVLGIRTAHLGRISGNSNAEHHDARQLARMYRQIQTGDFKFDLLQYCEGLADYPACCFDILQRLDKQYPESLFINVRRDRSRLRWIQSVERQFVGLELTKDDSSDDRAFMRVMQYFREQTFGQATFAASVYLDAYESYQTKIENYFSDRPNVLLSIADVGELSSVGFESVCAFLQCDLPDVPFPAINRHSTLPAESFMRALQDGRIQSQTGIATELIDEDQVLPAG